MKAIWEVSIAPYILSLVLDNCEWTISHSGRYATRKEFRCQLKRWLNEPQFRARRFGEKKIHLLFKYTFYVKGKKKKTHTHIHAQIHTYMHTYIHTCIRTYIHTYICTCTHINICIHIDIHTCIHTYTHTIHTYTHTYVCTHTHHGWSGKPNGFPFRKEIRRKQ